VTIRLDVWTVKEEMFCPRRDERVAAEVEIEKATRELVLVAMDDKVWKRPVPATSRRVVGELVPIPTKLERRSMVGTDKAVVEAVLKRVAPYPGSKRISPVVVMRIRSEVEEPRKKRSSWVPAPVETSAMAVLL
jgi:hypothetical protein